MPTPEWVKEASRKKRTRVCVICNTTFLVKKASEVGRTCSRPCRLKHQSNLKLGKKASAETRAKMSAGQKRANKVEGRLEKRREAALKGLLKWHRDPKNAEEFAKRSSERMRRRHADPEWQEVRDARSSRTLKRTWLEHRDVFVEYARERYAQGLGLNSEEAKRNKAAAGKWIMKKCREALLVETDYSEVFKSVQERLRAEMPYDGPKEGSDYQEYSKKLGAAVVNSPECRAIIDPFMSEAIGRFAKKWQRKKAMEEDND